MSFFRRSVPQLFRNQIRSVCSTRTTKHVLKISDLSQKELQDVLKFATVMKKNPKDYATSLKDKTLLMLFEKPSLRTRVSFETGMTQMGGHGIFYSIADSPLGQKETFGDTGQVLSRYCDVIMARVKNRRDVRELAKHSTIPVINALDDWAHPCQMLADLLTIAEYKGGVDKLSQIRMCYLGDCHNNVTYDLMRSACVLGFHINVCGPVHAGNGKEHHVDGEVLEECKDICKQYHNTTDLSKWLTITDKPETALRDSIDVIYTDSWMSYGVDPKDKERRMRTFMPYQVDMSKLKMAKSDCIFMNCLPAIRGMEQTADVIDGPQSVVFDQAENRLHAQKALLFYLVHGHMDMNQVCTEQGGCGYESCKDTRANNKRHKCESAKDQCAKKRILVALGGNALKKPKEKGTNEEMLENVRESCRQMVKLIDHHNYQLIVTHGNGPQVGSLFFQQQVSQEVTPAMPLNVCGAMSQGQIGYMLQQCLYNELLKDECKRDESLHDKIVTVVTQVVVDPSDPAWGSPSKPVGKFMSKDEALALQKEKGYFVMEDAGRGWRVAVASPKPIDIVEKNSIAQLCDDGYIIIASGGGGIPVIRSSNDSNSIEGRDAVIDKDLAAVLLGVSVSADVLMIATDVDAVYLNYTKGAEKKKLEKMTIAEAKEYYKAGHFAKGSMGPKILAAVEFVEKTGKVCIIGSLDQIEQAIRGEKGTVIVP